MSGDEKYIVKMVEKIFIAQKTVNRNKKTPEVKANILQISDGTKDIHMDTWMKETASPFNKNKLSIRARQFTKEGDKLAFETGKNVS